MQDDSPSAEIEIVYCHVSDEEVDDDESEVIQPEEPKVETKPKDG
jgi:hypothetical protein